MPGRAALAEIGRRMERVERRLEQLEEAASSPLIAIADRPSRVLHDLLDSELMVLVELRDPEL